MCNFASSNYGHVLGSNDSSKVHQSGRWGQIASLSLEGAGLGNLHIGLGTLICDLILFIVHNYVVLHLFMSNVNRIISGQFGSVNYKQAFPTEGLGVDCRVFFLFFSFFIFVMQLNWLFMHNAVQPNLVINRI